MLIRLKACPRCRGDLFLDEGTWVCLQCGHREYDKPFDLGNKVSSLALADCIFDKNHQNVL